MSAFASTGSLPVIDIGPLVQAAARSSRTQQNDDSEDPAAATATQRKLTTEEWAVVQEIGQACRHVGFFYVSNHGISDTLIRELTTLSRAFFALDEETKNSISMDKAGRAWRGFFPVGNEVTSGVKDQKEGIYFGTQLPASDPRCIRGKPLHGQNLYYPPADQASSHSFRSDRGRHMSVVVEEYMAACTDLGLLLMRAIALSLHLDEAHFKSQFQDPTTLFRIFNYPPHDGLRYGETSLGVGEHTDYGYITLLNQDTEVEPGEVNLEVRDLTSSSNWIPAPPIPGTFVVNLGDALEHCTGGLLRATPHRVRQRAGAKRGRMSFPFFFDPSFDSQMTSLVELLTPEDAAVVRENHRMMQAFQGGEGLEVSAGDAARYRRWDNQDVTQFRGTYGEYLLAKVAKVFPELASKTAVQQEAAK